jgi:capsular polysaccharide biosynthesis protein
VTLLISADAPPFVDETLDLLDWPDSRIVRADHESYRVSELLVPSFPDRRSMDFEWLREEVLRSVSDHSPESETNIYVSRANGVERRVVNEDEVMDTLREFNFECYLLEERSLAENARLFANADIIVGPHGAGLTDIIFAGDATLIELFGQKVKQPYKLLAEAVGVDYEPVHCMPESTDIVVDIEELSERIVQARKG